MMIPTIHLNGTGKTSLLGELEEAYKAIDAAIDALRQVTVHGRDYYVQGPDAYRVARAEMDLRLGKLHDVGAELLEMHAKIRLQGGNR